VPNARTLFVGITDISGDTSIGGDVILIKMLMVGNADILRERCRRLVERSSGSDKATIYVDNPVRWWCLAGGCGRKRECCNVATENVFVGGKMDIMGNVDICGNVFCSE
jgi:hypothetical protein